MEAGLNPARSRHCISGAIGKMSLEKSGKAPRAMIDEPGDMLVVTTRGGRLQREGIFLRVKTDALASVFYFISSFLLLKMSEKGGYI